MARIGQPIRSTITVATTLLIRFCADSVSIFAEEPRNDIESGKRPRRNIKVQFNQLEVGVVGEKPDFRQGHR